MNFLSNLRSKETVEEPMNASSDVAYGVGFVPEVTTLVNVDRTHLYKDESGGAKASFGAY